MNVGEKIKQIYKGKGLQQKEITLEVGLDQSNYNIIENDKKEPSVEVLQKIASIFFISVDELLNLDYNKKLTPVTVDDKSLIYKMFDTMLTKKKFQEFFHQNIAVI